MKQNVKQIKYMMNKVTTRKVEAMRINYYYE